MTRILATLALCAAPVLAGAADTPTTWDSIAGSLYGTRPLQDGTSMIAIDAPYRSENDSRTQIAARIAAPAGLRIGRVTLVLDENPMPVSADFALNDPQERFFFDVTMRVNGPTPVHVVAETTDGRLFVAETFVKTSGQGACAAPPGTDPDAALATLGEMILSVAAPGTQASAMDRLATLGDHQRRLDVDISHPSHSGMQMDQISLLFIPMRYVSDVAIDLDGQDYVDMTGSISLSENPRVALSVPGAAQMVDVTMTDTDGTVSSAALSLSGY
ncbi:quinoprotein dehydrogenase-associated SoxYZ-like carrier [Roseivivax isoporae]|uniref:Sulfur oxidation protein SoxZ n=1 Tax=Roseivivax isoporae LMG 25204 TaxID=1449351 RepID=X7FC27_9RHOB|nr:quinoprotein dehydrogenase-associated SoxYZ-like carrier [Roseivivax isoporae]ETX29579.1 sulfur oxidation protein SoxZ [Roseivivax isoporae LMG 25204]